MMKISKSKQPKLKKSMPSQNKEIKGMLVNGEEIILNAELHGAIYWKPVALLIVALWLYFYIQPLGMLLGGAGVIMLCITILTKHYLLLVVTNKRVLARYGLLQMDIVDIRLSKIESIDLERMLPGHLFGYANVVVMGTGQRLIRVPYIRNADSFRRYYNEMVLADEGNEDAEAEIKKSKDAQEVENKSNKSNKI